MAQKIPQKRPTRSVAKPSRQSRRHAAGALEVSAGQFADLCGVHHNTVGNWIKEGLPHLRSRRLTKIDVAAGFTWVRTRDRAEHETELATLRDARGSEASKAARAAADARMRELDLAEREGTLISADDVEARWTQIVIATREAVMGLPAIAVQSGLIDPARETHLTAICRDALAALAGEMGGTERAVA